MPAKSALRDPTAQTPASAWSGTGLPEPPFGGAACVSVVIPTHNRRDLLRRAIRSVQEQTYDNWELLVVDGGSTDGTAAVVEDLGDPRIRVVDCAQSRGGGHNRAVGALASGGQFIAFLDSDDFWLPQKLDTQLAMAADLGSRDFAIMSPPHVYDGRYYYRTEKTPQVPGVLLADHIYVTGAIVLSSGVMVGGELGRRLTFDPELAVNQDTDYVLRLEAAGVKIICMDTPLWVYDNVPRSDRINYRPENVAKSLAWSRRVSANWSRSARRGFVYHDTAMRYARTGSTLKAIFCWLTSIRSAGSAWHAARQLVRILGRGAVPNSIRGPWRYLRGKGVTELEKL